MINDIYFHIPSGMFFRVVKENGTILSDGCNFCEDTFTAILRIQLKSNVSRYKSMLKINILNKEPTKRWQAILTKKYKCYMHKFYDNFKRFCGPNNGILDTKKYTMFTYLD
jgi:hypothetical protein